MTPEQKDTLRAILEPFPELDAVYLFGSHATGRTHAESDLDLGLVGDAEALDARKLDILTELARNGFDRVDLVLFDTAPPALAHEIVKHNQLLFAREHVPTSTLYSNAIRRYLDFAPFLRVQAAAYRKRVIRLRASATDGAGR